VFLLQRKTTSCGELKTRWSALHFLKGLGFFADAYCYHHRHTYHHHYHQSYYLGRTVFWPSGSGIESKELEPTNSSPVSLPRKNISPLYTLSSLSFFLVVLQLDSTLGL
jgi:hypothetical protein